MFNLPDKSGARDSRSPWLVGTLTAFFVSALALAAGATGSNHETFSNWPDTTRHATAIRLLSVDTRAGRAPYAFWFSQPLRGPLPAGARELWSADHPQAEVDLARHLAQGTVARASLHYIQDGRVRKLTQEPQSGQRPAEQETGVIRGIQETDRHWFLGAGRIQPSGDIEPGFLFCTSVADPFTGLTSATRVLHRSLAHPGNLGNCAAEIVQDVSAGIVGPTTAAFLSRVGLTYTPRIESLSEVVGDWLANASLHPQSPPVLIHDWNRTAAVLAEPNLFTADGRPRVVEAGRFDLADANLWDTGLEAITATTERWIFRDPSHIEGNWVVNYTVKGAREKIFHRLGGFETIATLPESGYYDCAGNPPRSVVIMAVPAAAYLVHLRSQANNILPDKTLLLPELSPAHFKDLVDGQVIQLDPFEVKAGRDRGVELPQQLHIKKTPWPKGLDRPTDFPGTALILD